MKKQGKFTKQSETVAEKQPKVKSALLQTYLTSLLCMVLCVAMFLGTSYAWFTSEVNNEANEIYVGTLNVGFFKQGDTANPWLDLADENIKLFDKSIRWEPGYTTLETVKIINTGDLTFKYTLGFTDGAITDKAGIALTEDQLMKVANYFDVWVYDHEANENKSDVVPNPTSYTALTAQNSGWVSAGTLDKILAGDSVLVGTMPEIPQNTAQAGRAIDAGAAAGDTYTIALHMSEGATADVMGHKISLNAKLVAYQMGVEEDAFGNAGYDSNLQLISTLEDLQKAVDEAEGGEVFVLDEDMTGNLIVTQKPDVKFTIDGNGHKFGGVITVDGKSATYTTAGLTIRNVNFEAESISADACIRLGDGTNATRYTCNVTVNGCTFNVPGAVGIKSYTGGDKNLTITGCTATANAHSLAQLKGIDGVLIENCEVNSVRGVNFNNSDNVTVINSTIDVQKYAVRFGESSGGAGTAETYLIKDCKLVSDCEENDAVIILRGTADYATLTVVNTTIEGNLWLTNEVSDTAKVIGLN